MVRQTRRSRLSRWAACGLVAALGLFPAAAAPPPDADPALHTWFERQHSLRGTLCCSVADGHILADDQWRANGAYYEVYIQGEWHRILPSQLRDPNGGPNPTGRAIVWYTVQDHVVIYCFAPGLEL